MNFVLGKNKQNLKDDLCNSETYQIRKLNDTIPIFDEKNKDKSQRADLSQNDESEPDYTRRKGILFEDPAERVIVIKHRNRRLICMQVVWMLFLMMTIGSLVYEIFYFTQNRNNLGY